MTNDVINISLNKDFKLINGKPTYATIKLVNDKLSTNAAAIHSTLSDSKHSILGLVISSKLLYKLKNSMQKYYKF